MLHFCHRLTIYGFYFVIFGCNESLCGISMGTARLTWHDHSPVLKCTWWWQTGWGLHIPFPAQSWRELHPFACLQLEPAGTSTRGCFSWTFISRDLRFCKLLPALPADDAGRATAAASGSLHCLQSGAEGMRHLHPHILQHHPSP